MNKTLYTLLIGLIGFYALLFASLLLRACAGYLQARRPEPTKPEKVSEIAATRTYNNSRAWTSAVWRGKLAQEVQRIEQVTAAPQPHTAKAL